MSEVSREQRVIRFPEERSVGILSNLGSWPNISAQSLLTPAETREARGEIAVGRNDMLKLQVNSTAATDLSFVSALQPNDLTFLDLSDTGVTDAQIPHLQHLEGVESVRLDRTSIS